MPKLRAMFSRVSRPFWWPTTTTGAAVEAREAADHGLVVAVDPIAVELHPVLDEQSDEIEGARALRVPRDLGALPGRQAPVDLLLEPCEAVLEASDLVAGAPGVSAARSCERRFSISVSGFSKSSSSSILDEYTARPEERLDFCHHGGAGIDEQLLDPHHDLLIGQEHVHEERRAAPVVLTDRSEGRQPRIDRVVLGTHPDPTRERRARALRPPAAAAASSRGLISSASTTRPLSLSSVRPRTRTGPECRKAPTQLRYGSGNTVTGTVPSTSSSVTNAIRLPLLVAFSVTALIIPRSRTRAPTGRAATSPDVNALNRRATSR